MNPQYHNIMVWDTEAYNHKLFFIQKQKNYTENFKVSSFLAIEKGRCNS